jgi:hypothetical protein
MITKDKNRKNRLHDRDWLLVSTVRWFRQAQPPRLAFGFYREVVSTGSTTAALSFRFLPSGGFDRLNHRDWAFGFYRAF